jgi:hypothetical protein
MSVAAQQAFQRWALWNFAYDCNGRLSSREYNDAVITWPYR